MYRLAAFALAISVSANGVAWAGPACDALVGKGCDCAVGIASGATIGDLIRQTARVEKTGGFTPTRMATSLSVGDRVTVGLDDMISVNVGPRCRSHLVPGGSTLSVSAIGDCACVRIELTGAIAAGPSPATPGTPASPDPPPPLLNGMNTGLMMVAIDAALITTLVLNEKPVSP